MINLVNLFLSLFVFHAYGSSCFNGLEAEKLANLKFKAQLICSEEGLNDCKEILLAKAPMPEFKEEEKPLTISCLQGQSKMAYVMPLAASATMGLTQLRDYLVNDRKSYVNSVVDFYQHTQLHRKRVKLLALQALEKFPEEFEGVSKEMAARVLEHHDEAKVNPAYRHSGGNPFYEELYKHYGNKAPQDVVNQLNAADGKIMENVMAKEGLEIKATDSVLEKAKKIKIKTNLLKLEKLADFTDRGFNPVTPEEFGRKTWLESTAAAKEGDRKLAAMARYLEKNYRKFAKGFFYAKLPPLQYFNLSQKLTFYKKFGNVLSSGRTLKEISARSMEGLTKALSTAVKIGSKIPGPTEFDMATLLLTPTDTACSADPGYHDWTTKAGKCFPQIGLTPKFISFINLPPEQRQREYAFGQYMCYVTKENLKINEASIFRKVSCSKEGARMQVSDNNFLDLKYDSSGSISELDLDNFDMSFGLFTATPSKIILKNGLPEQECFVHGLVKKSKSCKRVNKSQKSAIYEKLSSLNYMIYREVACCLGIKNEFNGSAHCKGASPIH